jgi:hypothetical protein
MSFKIDSDVNRFKQIIKNKIKHNLGKYISSDKLIGQQGNKKIFIPLDFIDLPRFTFGSDLGGVGQGNGDIGNPIDDFVKQHTGKNKAGNEKGDHKYLAEFTVEELATILADELKLPNIEEKGKGKVPSTKNKYTGLRKVGPNGLRHFKRTYKEALKRHIASGTYNPSDPSIIPIKSDKRYRYPYTIEQPNINAVSIYIMDISGSMGDKEKHIVKSIVFWIDTWLRSQYKDIESRFIVHDTEAFEVDRDTFFSISESGGTMISSAYHFCYKLMEKYYPFSEWNVYPFHFSDGDSWSDTDNEDACLILKEKILPNCNLFSYGQVNSYSGSGEFIKYLFANFSQESKVSLAEISDMNDILNCIKTFLGKGK